MKVLITGSRYGYDYGKMLHILQDLSSSKPLIIQGGCKGVDIQAREIAISLGYEVKTYYANWHQFGNAAGMLRNQEMIDKEHVVDSPIDVCYAFHKDFSASKGTKDMIKRCKKYSIPVILYD